MPLIVQVILRLKLSRHLDIFDYEVPEIFRLKIRLGSIVLVPFRRKQELAVVVALHPSEKPPTSLRSILRIFEGMIVPSLYLESFRNIAKYYAVSPGLLLTLVVPEISRSTKLLTPKHSPFVSNFQPLHFPVRRRGEIIEWLDCIKWKNSGEYLFHYFLEQEKLVFYLAIIKKFIRFPPSGQVVIIVPQFLDIKRLEAFLPPSFRENLVIWHGGQAKHRVHMAFRSIVSGSAKIILGTPVAVLLPYAKIGAMIVDEEERAGHSLSDKNPRYSSQAVGAIRSRYEGFPLILTSAFPSVVSYFRAKRSNTLIIPKLATHKTRYSLFPLKDELHRSDFTFLTPRLLDRMRPVLEHGDRVLLFFNRRGFARRFVCRDCGFVLRCSRCHSPFIVTRSPASSTFVLRCHHCQKQEFPPSFCSSCHGVHFKQKGFGTERLVSELRSLFPSFSLDLLDRDHPASLTRAQLVIGTEYALRRISWSEFHLVAILAADNSPHGMSWRETESWQSTIAWIFMQARSFNIPELIVQTFQPEYLGLASIFKENYELFYTEELAFRKRFFYPPFVSLVRFLCYDTDQRRLEELTRTVVSQLKTRVHSLDTVLSPPFFQKKGRRLYSSWFVRLPISSKLTFDWLPDACLIDPDPIKFF